MWIDLGLDGGITYTNAGGVGHSLDGNLVTGERLELSGDLGADDGSHVAGLGGTASEDEGQLLAGALGGNFVGSHAALR